MNQSRWKTHQIVNSLYFRVIVGLLAGVATGILYPNFAQALKPLGDGFIKLVRMLVTPIIFLTVVSGIAGMGDTRRLGRIGLKALFYFEVVTTIALAIGIAAAHLLHPGAGMNVDVRTLDSKTIEQYVHQGHQLKVATFLLDIIPDSFIGSFAAGDILQILVLATLTGIALVTLKEKQSLLNFTRSASALFFRITGVVMQLAPIAIFGSMGFTVGRYGIAVLLSLGKVLICVYAASLFFLVVILGFICMMNGVNLLRLVLYLKEELLIVIGTSSSEPALPGLIAKMERLGCPEAIAGLVVPAGYSFNLDGTSIYLAVAALFVAQATNTHLSLGQEAFLMLVLMLNSKGAAAVTGSGFITLAATLAALGTIPVVGITLLLGIDRFMSEMRSVINLIGNAVATIAVARWEGQFDPAYAKAVLQDSASPASALVPNLPAEAGLDSI